MNQVEHAAERVLQALRALNTHRHSSAPTLERDYQRALETYFDAAERAVGRNPDRDELAETTAIETPIEDDLDPRVEEGRHVYAAISAHYAAAKHAIRLVRVYR